MPESLNFFFLPALPNLDTSFISGGWAVPPHPLWAEGDWSSLNYSGHNYC